MVRCFEIQMTVFKFQLLHIKDSLRGTCAGELTCKDGPDVEEQCPKGKISQDSDRLFYVFTGGNTQLVSVLSSILMLIVLLWLGPLFEPVPKSALAVIIILALKNLFLQFEKLKALWSVSKSDFVSGSGLVKSHFTECKLLTKLGYFMDGCYITRARLQDFCFWMQPAHVMISRPVLSFRSMKFANFLLVHLVTIILIPSTFRSYGWRHAVLLFF